MPGKAARARARNLYVFCLKSGAPDQREIDFLSISVRADRLFVGLPSELLVFVDVCCLREG